MTDDTSKLHSLQSLFESPSRHQSLTSTLARGFPPVKSFQNSDYYRTIITECWKEYYVLLLIHILTVCSYDIFDGLNAAQILYTRS